MSTIVPQLDVSSETTAHRDRLGRMYSLTSLLALCLLAAVGDGNSPQDAADLVRDPAAWLRGLGLLVDRVVGMTRRETIEGRVLLLRHIRCPPHAVPDVVAAVGPQYARAVAPLPDPVQKFWHHILLGRASGLADREVHQQTVAVLH